MSGAQPRNPGIPPVWTAPRELAMGRLGSLELRQPDPALPPPPRPGDSLGPLAVRGVEPLADGRGWRITVQPLAPGLVRVPPLDLGDGRPTAALTLAVPRTTAYGAPWMGVGGGALDRLPNMGFPWIWTLPPLALLAAAAWLLARGLVRGTPARRRRAARRAFARHWPPADRDRAALDAAHAAGRTLLAARFGPEALSWGPAVCRERGLEPWAAWIRSVDAARFGLAEPAFPPLQALLAALEDR